MGETVTRMQHAAAGALAAAALTGCAATSPTTDGSGAPVPSASATAVTTTPTTSSGNHTNGRSAHAVRLAPAHRSARAGLPVSTASSTAVQPQPPPGSCHATGSGLYSLPDRRCTPGAIAGAVTQATIHSTICVSGYTKRVRPRESITDREKLASMRSYGDSRPPHYYEYDHLVSLELGGAPNDSRNLWPEPGSSPNPKDRLEDRLHALVCDGAMTLAAAQQQVAGDWVTAYHRQFG